MLIFNWLYNLLIFGCTGGRRRRTRSASNAALPAGARRLHPVGDERGARVGGRHEPGRGGRGGGRGAAAGWPSGRCRPARPSTPPTTTPRPPAKRVTFSLVDLQGLLILSQCITDTTIFLRSGMGYFPKQLLWKCEKNILFSNTLS
ncbi:Protein of unknown function, partial [Gryllus bimaculatus]